MNVRFIGNWPLGPSNAVAMDTARHIIFLASGGGAYILNVEDSSNPQKLGHYNTPDYAYGVYVSGPYAYVADGYYGLRIVDITNPASPDKVGYYYGTGMVISAYVEGSYVYVGKGEHGLEVYENLFADVHEQHNKQAHYKGLRVIMYRNGAIFRTNRDLTKQMEVSIYNTSGRLVKEVNIRHRYYFKPKESEVYFYMVKNRTIKEHGKFVVIH